MRNSYQFSGEIHDNIYLECDVYVESGGSCKYGSEDSPWSEIDIKNYKVFAMIGNSEVAEENIIVNFDNKSANSYVYKYYEFIIERIESD